MPKSSTLTTSARARRADAQEHVVGLEIAVDDAARVCGGQRLRELSDHSQRKREIPREPGDASHIARERLALEVLHHDVRLLVDDVAVEHFDDPGMADRRGCARLGEETLKHIGLPRPLWKQNLDRGAALDAVVLGQIDPPHAASPQLPEHGVTPDAAPDRDHDV